MSDSNTCVTFQWVGEENCEIYIDDDYVGDLNYEELGWTGIESTVQLLNRIIIIKGWDVKVEGDPGI